MKFKLDENIGELGRDLLLAAGHDVSTIDDQGMSGVADENLYETCCIEDRALVTLDRDFGEVLRFPRTRPLPKGGGRGSCAGM